MKKSYILYLRNARLNEWIEDDEMIMMMFTSVQKSSPFLNDCRLAMTKQTLMKFNHASCLLHENLNLSRRTFAGIKIFAKFIPLDEISNASQLMQSSLSKFNSNSALYCYTVEPSK